MQSLQYFADRLEEGLQQCDVVCDKMWKLGRDLRDCNVRHGAQTSIVQPEECVDVMIM